MIGGAIASGTMTATAGADTIGKKVSEPVLGKKYTVPEYASWLREYNLTTAKKSGISDSDADQAVSDAHSAYVKFESMSNAEKQDIVSQLGAVAVKDAAGDYFKSSSDTPLIVPYSSAYGYSKSKRQRSTQYTAITDYTVNKTFCVKVRVKVNYKTKGKKVLRTTSSDDRVIKDLDPLVNYKHNKTWRHVTKNHAYTRARWKRYLSGVHAQTGEMNASVHGNYMGYRSSYHWWFNK